MVEIAKQDLQLSVVRYIVPFQILREPSNVKSFHLLFTNVIPFSRRPRAGQYKT